MMNHKRNALLAGVVALAHWTTTVAAQDTSRGPHLNWFQGHEYSASSENPRMRTAEEGDKIAYQVHARVILLINLAEIYAAQGKYSQAELLYRQWLEKEAKTLAAEHPDVMTW